MHTTLPLQSVTGEPWVRCRVPAMACQLRRWLQRARHRTQTWLGCRERVEHAHGTPATLWSALLNGQATVEAVVHSGESRRESHGCGRAVCLRWRATCDACCTVPAIAPRRDWAAEGASSTLSARLPRFGVRYLTGRQR